MKKLFIMTCCVAALTAYAQDEEQVYDANKSQISSELFARGNDALEFQKYDEAKNYFAAAISYFSENPDYYYGLGMAQYYMKEYDSALFNLEKALAFDDQQANYHYYAGATWYEKGEYDKAIGSYWSAIGLNRTSDIRVDIKTCWFQIGLSEMKLKKYTAAVESFTQALAKDPDNDKAALNRGICYAMSQDFESACADFYQSALQGNERAKQFLDKYCPDYGKVVLKD